MTLSGLEQNLMSLKPALARFIASRGVRPGDVEDVFQDLFVRLRTNPPGPVDEPRAYLYRMADNIIIDRKRSLGRRAKREAAWDETLPGRGLSPASGGDAERALAGRQEIAAIVRVLSVMPERTREIFRLFRLDGRTQRDIAADFSISLSAVEKHLQRAYRAIIDERARLDAGVGDPIRQGEREDEGETDGG